MGSIARLPPPVCVRRQPQDTSKATALLKIPNCTENPDVISIAACLSHPHHCTSCGEPTGTAGHFVGGSRPDARVICNPEQRRAFLRFINDTTTPGRRYRDGD